MRQEVCRARIKKKGSGVLNSLEKNCYNGRFSHIYVEEAVWNHPRTQKILSRFPQAQVIPVHHYKDVFCRRGQSVVRQHKTQNLILAEKKNNLIYQGAPVCQSFGNHWFYYTSCMMNCIYDCEYCYLKGMYPSANVVLFVNLEDIFAEVERLLEQHSVYLCVSYDTDLLAVEPVIGYTAEWMRFTTEHENLTIEVRTKSANVHYFKQQAVTERVIFAFTMSPQPVIAAYEHFTPDMQARIACAAEAVQWGFSVRLAFDPMIYCKDWENVYAEMLQCVDEQIDWKRLVDVSVGSFRISKEYLKNIYTILFTIPGIPSIYYGSEWAIEGDRKISDLNLRPELFLEDFENDIDAKNIEKFISNLISIRTKNIELTQGCYKEILVKNKQFVFGRGYNDKWILIALNLDNKEEILQFNVPFANSTLINLLDKTEKLNVKDYKLNISIPAFSSKILKEEE